MLLLMSRLMTRHQGLSPFPIKAVPNSSLDGSRRSALQKRQATVLKRNREPLRLFEIARVLVRLDHVAGIIANANHSII